MTFIKALLFPLAVCVVLLLPEYELDCLDEYWSGTADDEFSPPAIGSNGWSDIVPDERACPPPCSAVVPADDGADNDD
jgi:hypothetical protein